MNTELQVLDVRREDGQVRLVPRETVANRPEALARVTTSPEAEALLLWDPDLPLPGTDLVARLLDGPCHVWHAGLLLGQGGRPDAWYRCHGRAMLSRDVDASIASSSWKLSTRAVIARNDVIDTFGGFDASFDTTSGMALDAGLRWVECGALIRHVPELMGPGSVPERDEEPTTADGARIVRRRLGRIWAAWALARGVITRVVRPRDLPGALRTLWEPPPRAVTARGLPAPHAEIDPDARVTVLVPTVGRYPYLETLLTQLEQQTVRPHEVLVVDQNPLPERRDLASIAPDLPLRVLHLLPPGQCTARNLGLRSSTGSHILFLDDDDEIPPDLIEHHLRVLACPGVSASCGVVDDRESGPAPTSELYRKIAQVFPTNNTMIRREVLAHAGLFDPTYDKGARADHDLGMRSYLLGNLHVHDPRPRVFHHHAPMGGLRTHGARVRTRGNSRSTIIERHLRTPTDVYLGLRYYRPEQVHEDLVLSVFTPLAGGGPLPRRALRFIVQVALLPDTWRKVRAVRSAGQLLLDERPELPTLDGAPP